MSSQDFSALIVLGIITTALITQWLRNKKEAKAGARINSGGLPYILLIMESVSGAFNFSLGYNLGASMFGAIGGLIAGALFATINFSYRYIIRFFVGCVQHKQGYLLMGLSLIAIGGVFALSQWAFSHHMNAVMHVNDNQVIANDAAGDAKILKQQARIQYLNKEYSEAIKADDEKKMADYEYYLGMANANLKQAQADKLINRPAEYGFEKNDAGHYLFATMLGIVIELAIICLCLYETIFIAPVIKMGHVTLLDKVVDWNHRKLYNGLLEGWFEKDKNPMLTADPVLSGGGGNAVYNADESPRKGSDKSQKRNTHVTPCNTHVTPASHKDGGGSVTPSRNTHVTPSNAPVTPSSNTHVTPHEDNTELTAILGRIEEARAVLVGENMGCAICGSGTLKRTDNKLTCSGKCRIKLNRLKKQGLIKVDQPKKEQGDKTETVKPVEKGSAKNKVQSNDYQIKKQPEQGNIKGDELAQSNDRKIKTEQGISNKTVKEAKPPVNNQPDTNWTHFIFNQDGSMVASNATNQRHFKVKELSDLQKDQYLKLHAATSGQRVTLEQANQMLRGVPA